MNEFTLVGVNGNAFCVIAYTCNAMKKVGINYSEIQDYKKKVTQSDYDTVIVLSLEQLDRCNSMLRAQQPSFAVFGPGRYFIGDICYALPDEIYDEIWGDKYKYQDGCYLEYGFATHGTAYGDGCYAGTDGVDYCVDAGNIGIVNITSQQRYDDQELSRLGKVVDVKDSIIMNCDEMCTFEFTVDGKTFEIVTGDTDEEDDWEEEEE